MSASRVAALAAARPQRDDGAMSHGAPRSLPARILLGLVGLVQIAFTLFAFLDLAGREQHEVRMPKAAWIPILLVNWIGPASYFAVGVKR